MKMWLVFSGYSWEDIKDGGDPEWFHRLELHTDWVKARDALMAVVRRFVYDLCETCASDGQETMRQLIELEPNQGYWCNIDGDDRVLAAVDLAVFPRPEAMAMEEADIRVKP